MENLNYILNINNHNYNIDDNELLAFKEANILLEKNYILYALNETWLAFYSQLLRRVEYFSLEHFLDKYPQLSLYKADEQKVLLRWENYDANTVLKHALTLNIIDDISFHLLNVLHKLKFSVDQKLNKDNYFNIVELLISTLLTKPFIQSNNLSSTNLQRRSSDKIRKDRRQRDQRRRATDKLPSKIIDESKLIKSNAINPFTTPIKLDNNQIEKYC